MARPMRAKFVIESVTRNSASTETEVLKMRAVTNGTPEDNTFAKYTPAASLEMTITNPLLVGKFEAGEKFYVDFTPVTE